MSYLGWSVLIYAAFVVDVCGRFYDVFSVSPACLDLVLLLMLKSIRGSMVVFYGAGVGALSAIVLGTSLALEMVAAASLAWGTLRIRTFNVSGSSSFLHLPLLAGVLLTTGLVRLSQISWTSMDWGLRQELQWRLAGATALTLLAGVVIMAAGDLLTSSIQAKRVY